MGFVQVRLDVVAINISNIAAFVRAGQATLNISSYYLSLSKAKQRLRADGILMPQLSQSLNVVCYRRFAHPFIFSGWHSKRRFLRFYRSDFCKRLFNDWSLVHAQPRQGEWPWLNFANVIEASVANSCAVINLQCMHSHARETIPD